MPRFHKIKGAKVQFTAEEEAQRDAEEAEQITLQEEKAVIVQKKIADKASGNQKLLDLGLSQDEVDALLR